MHHHELAGFVAIQERVRQYYEQGQRLGGSRRRDREPTSKSGITSYADSSSSDGYIIKGFGKTSTLTLILSAGNL